MSGSLKPTPGVELSETAEERNTMAVHSMRRLQHRAFSTLHTLGCTNTDIVMVCIEVDSRWRSLVEHLMPGNELAWQKKRDAGDKPLALGSVTWHFTKYLSDQFPDITDVILEKPAEGKVKCAVLNQGGLTIIEIEPKLDPAEVM